MSSEPLPLTIPRLRAVVTGASLDDAPVTFEYLAQRGVLTYKEQDYQFPLWPTQKLPQAFMFSTAQAMPFWFMISRHWTHQSFLDESFYFNFGFYAGFVCVRCGIRAMLPLHSYVSINLMGATYRGYRTIRERGLNFELNRLNQLGLDTSEVTGRRLAVKMRYDPILDWRRELV